MWWKRKKLKSLFDELTGITVLERLYASRTDLTEDDRHAQVVRQTRQSELMAEIARLNPAKSNGRPQSTP